MEALKLIFTERASDYKVIDIILKAWIAGLMALFAVGFVLVMYGIISGEADIENATFGVFDTLGY